MTGGLIDVMTHDPLIIIARNCTLPEDEGKKQQSLQAFKSALANACLDYDVYPDSFAIFDGHIYSQVELSCPDCGDNLAVREFNSGPGNGADATAKCSCGFQGRAVYRLIDLERNTDNTTVDAMFDTGSCVADGAPVQYTPYEQTGHHIPE